MSGKGEFSKSRKMDTHFGKDWEGSNILTIFFNFSQFDVSFAILNCFCSIYLAAKRICYVVSYSPSLSIG